MRFLLLIVMVMMASCATTPKGLTPKTNGTTCASGNANVCYKQGKRFEQGKNVTQNKARAIMYYDKACMLDHEEGCLRAARGYERADDPKLKKPARARVLYKRLCDHNIDEGCRRLYNNYIDHPQQQADIQQGVIALDKLCNKHPDACYELGKRYYFARHLTHNNFAAKNYFLKGCKLNSGASCHMLARWFKAEQLGGMKNKYLYAQKGCSLDIPYACVKQYQMMFRGQGTKKQERAGLKGLGELCTKGFTPACFAAIHPIAKGTSLSAPNPKMAMEVLTALCKQEHHPRACALSGQWYDYEWYGTSFNISEVLFYYHEGCKHGSPAACINLGLIYKHGRGVKQDHTKAFTLFKATCQKGTAYGCINLGVMYQRGFGVPKDLEKAKQLFTHHCDNKVTPACARLANWQYKGIHGPKDVKAATAKLKQICQQQEHNNCYWYGAALKEQGDTPGAIKAFEKQCKKDVVGAAVDSCMELVKLGQTQYKARADKLKTTQCRRLHKAYCPAAKQEGDKP